MYIIDKEITKLHKHTHIDEIERALSILRFTQKFVILSNT